MEGIHGVLKGTHHRSHAPTSPGLAKDAPPPNSNHGSPHGRHAKDNSLPSPPITPPAVAADKTTPLPTPPATVPSKTSRRPNIMGRQSSEKTSTQSSPEPSKPSPRRSTSWLSNISSKLSSQGTQPPQPTTASSNASAGRHTEEAATPQAPKASAPSFLSNALRRLSSTGPQGGSPKACANGGLCPRRVMNVDPNRPRVLVPELDQTKLRRVAFCVDVEIAGNSRYKDSDSGEKKKKHKDKKLKERGEGEALKNPKAVADEKEKEGVVQISREDVGADDKADPEGTILDEDKEEPSVSRKREKKKRSEEERKARKEKKRKKAEENGSIPLELKDDEEESTTSPPSTATTPMTQAQPTTDPLRIYKRCCQLRETGILKRISDQISKPTNCPIITPGVISTLDLTGSRLQLCDIQTLGDWLAVVPVKKLILTDSDLTDEGLRIILAGLLNAKVPHHSRRRRSSVTSMTENGNTEERLGCIIYLSIRNNPRLTRDAWKYLSTFIYLCRSIKSLDCSMNFFPQKSSRTPKKADGTAEFVPDPKDPVEIFARSISERLAGNRLEDLSMGECALDSEHIRRIVDAATMCGIKKLCFYGNNLDNEGLDHVIRYMQSDTCEGLDIGGNDLRDKLDRLVAGFSKKCSLWALNLAKCNLTPKSLEALFPGLMKLPQFKFIDLSNNTELFSSDPSALTILRKYIPKLPNLKKLHLNNVSLTSAQAIGLADVLPESLHLCYLSIRENPNVSALASATDEASQEEAVALYASLMAAARVSKTLVSIEIESPSQDSSEVVQALAKQIVAYCLRNLDYFLSSEPLKSSEGEDISTDIIAGAASLTESLGPEKEVEIPEVLMHLVGHAEGSAEDDDAPAPDEDYIIGGTGVVKALSYCLSEKASDQKRQSLNRSGTATPTTPTRTRFTDVDVGKAKAMNMSLNLLGSARRIRARLQPAIVREAKAGDEYAYKRLQFLDRTLATIIQRFEDEYPETRIQSPDRSPSPAAGSTSSSLPTSGTGPSLTVTADSDSDAEEEDPTAINTRHASDVSMASKALAAEEGEVHRIGQRVRRDLVLRPAAEDQQKWEERGPEEQKHLLELKEKLERLSGEELKQFYGKGVEQFMEALDTNAEELRELQWEAPEEWEKWRVVQENAMKNAGMKTNGDSGESAVE